MVVGLGLGNGEPDFRRAMEVLEGHKRSRGIGAGSG